jgi:hypothetical protein
MTKNVAHAALQRLVALTGFGSAVAAAAAFVLTAFDAVGRTQVLLAPVFAGPSVAASALRRWRGLARSLTRHARIMQPFVIL